jgi:predicted acyltransferase
MILVNNPGSSLTYAQLQHSEWNGLTLTDTVFPTFLWIAGVSLVLSLGRRIENGAPQGQLLRQVSKRAIVLFLLGVLIYAIPRFDLGHLRIMGVLQRCAICYFAAALICMKFRPRAQMYWIVVLFAVYWLAMKLIPVPSHGPGDLSMAGNLAHYMDRIVLGTHNYAETRTWDPEGLLSTLPAIATTLLGLQAGYVLRTSQTLQGRARRLSVMGAILLLAGLICSIWLPVNKKIWTDSFALVMAGLDCFGLVAFLWLFELRAVRQPMRPLVIFGMNAIAVYVAAELLSIFLDTWQIAGRSAHRWIYSGLFAPLTSPYNASLLFSLCFTGAIFAIAYLLHKRSLYLRA